MPTGSTGFKSIFGGQSFWSFCPSTGPTASQTGVIGDVVMANPPVLGQPAWYIYTASGWTPGQTLFTQTAYTNTAAAALPNGYSMYILSPGGYAATLSSSTSTASGSRINLYASAAVTLSALTGESITGSTTLAAGSVSEFVDSGTVWFRVV